MNIKVDIQGVSATRCTMNLDTHVYRGGDRFCISSRNKRDQFGMIDNDTCWLIPKKITNFENLTVYKYGDSPHSNRTANFKNGLGIIKLTDGLYPHDIYVGQNVKVVKDVTTVKGDDRQLLVDDVIDKTFDPDDYHAIFDPMEIVNFLNFNAYDHLKSLDNPLINKVLSFPELKFIQEINGHKALDTSFGHIGGNVTLNITSNKYVYSASLFIVSLKNGDHEVFFRRSDLMDFVADGAPRDKDFVNFKGDEKRYNDIAWIMTCTDTTYQHWVLNIFDENLRTYHEISKIVGHPIHVCTITESTINDVLSNVNPKNQTVEDLNRVIAEFHGLKQEGGGKLFGRLNPKLYSPGDIVVTQVAGSDLIMTVTEEDTTYYQNYWHTFEGFKRPEIKDDIPF